jgi:hypothetical protein
MMRQRIVHTLLAASLAAFAMNACAQTTPSPQNNSPRNAPVGDAVAPPVGAATSGAGAPATPAMNAPTPAMGSPMGSDTPRDMSGYKAARAACDKGTTAAQEQCRNTVNTRYSGFAPKCQKLSGSALDDCIKGADHGQ